MSAPSRFFRYCSVPGLALLCSLLLPVSAEADTTISGNLIGGQTYSDPESLFIKGAVKVENSSSVPAKIQAPSVIVEQGSSLTVGQEQNLQISPVQYAATLQLQGNALDIGGTLDFIGGKDADIMTSGSIITVGTGGTITNSGGGVLTFTASAGNPVITVEQNGQIINSESIKFTGTAPISVIDPNTGLSTPVTDPVPLKVIVKKDGWLRSAQTRGDNGDISVDRNTTLIAEAGASLSGRTLLIGETCSVTVADTITLDGIGLDRNTFEDIEIVQNGTFAGNVVIELAADPYLQEGVPYGGLTLGGTYQGELTLKKGRLSLWQGSNMEGDLLLSGGTATLETGGNSVPEQPDSHPPVSVTGNIILNGADLIFASGQKLHAKSDLRFSAGNLEAGFGSVEIDGDYTQSGGRASIDQLVVGGTLTLDTPWDRTPGNMAVRNLSNGPDKDTAGSIRVGRNSYLALGTSDTMWLPNKVQEVSDGLSQNGIQAALGIYRPIVMANGNTITVGDSTNSMGQPKAVSDAPQENNPTFTGGSLLILNGADSELQSGKPAINFEGGFKDSVNVEDDAMLLITDAVVGKPYTVTNAPLSFEGGSYEDSTGWKGDVVETSSFMQEARFDPTSGTLTIEMRDAATAMPGITSGLAAVVDDMYASQRNDTNADELGIRFLSRATDDQRYVTDAAQGLKAIESAARMAISSVPQMLSASHSIAQSAVLERIGLATPQGSGLAVMNSEEKKLGLWATPLYLHWRGNGLDGQYGDLDVSADLGGVAVGVDQTFADGFKAGLTFNIGAGSAESEGDFERTDNDFSFWGVGAYAGWNDGKLGILADISYTATDNELKQNAQHSVDMGMLESDVDAWAMSAGLRGEYRFRTSVLDITPHVGMRYTHLNTNSYDVRNSMGTVLSGDSVEQDVWSFPVGLTLSKELHTADGWMLRPALDLSVIPAAGDLDAEGTIRFRGVDTAAALENQVWDSVTYGGQIGLELAKGGLSLALSYDLKAGAHTNAQAVFGSFRFKF